MCVCLCETFRRVGQGPSGRSEQGMIGPFRAKRVGQDRSSRVARSAASNNNNNNNSNNNYNNDDDDYDDNINEKKNYSNNDDSDDQDGGDDNDNNNNLKLFLQNPNYLKIK